MVRFAVLIACLIFAAASSFAGITCHSCKKPIEDSYLEVEGRYFHPAHFRCDNCKKAIGERSYHEINGRYYDKACYEKLFADRCDVCGDAITGRFYRDGEQKYHADCFTQHRAPRCETCRLPITAQYTLYHGKNYHVDCYENQVAKRCALCLNIIEGVYLKDNWGNSVHEYHKDIYAQCSYCQRFISESISGGGLKYADGRHICSLCQRTAVTDSAEAQRIMVDVAETLASVGINVTKETVPVALVSHQELQSESKRHGSNLLGLTTYRQTGWLAGLIKAHDFKILMLYGLPKTLFASSVAHELMHVWQYKNAPLNNDPLLCEGSCNYAAYLVLSRIDSRESDYYMRNLLEDHDPVYGEGFRKVKAYVDQAGISKWLEYLRENKKLAW